MKRTATTYTQPTKRAHVERDGNKHGSYFTTVKYSKIAFNIVKDFFNDMGISLDDICVIAPNAGEGAVQQDFQNKLLFDKYPTETALKNGVIEADSNTLDLSLYMTGKFKIYIVNENPNFNSKGTDHGIKFFNRMASFSQISYICVIFPDRFRSHICKRDLDKNFDLVYYSPIVNTDAFEPDSNGKFASHIKTSFQIWKRLDAPRVDASKEINVEPKRTDAYGMDPICWVQPSKTKTKGRCVVTKNRITPKTNKQPCPVYSELPFDQVKSVLINAIDQEDNHVFNVASHVAGNIQNLVDAIM
jgi:hypothetical protein